MIKECLVPCLGSYVVRYEDSANDRPGCDHEIDEIPESEPSRQVNGMAVRFGRFMMMVGFVMRHLSGSVPVSSLGRRVAILKEEAGHDADADAAGSKLEFR